MSTEATIIQIMPASERIYTMWGEEKKGTLWVSNVPVIGWALIEEVDSNSGNIFRYVAGLDLASDGEVEWIGSPFVKGFAGLSRLSGIELEEQQKTVEDVMNWATAIKERSTENESSSTDPHGGT